MTSSSWARSRRPAVVASVLTLIVVGVGVFVLAVGVSVAEAWWPHTGQAFTAGARDQDPCGLIVGPAKDYCQRGTTTSADVEQPDLAGAAWRLVPAGAGVAALVMWRRRSATGSGRR
ncbi:hypothetical protein OHT76_43385 [Streptomyces sp. NBC_00287]|uniref:hypothetical protein n=1 Tax=Streptomyces sp. NBC_00287 TaxID=2975702 RepID=UPI002E2AD507|nr:hypothetical protein [Streptomyces sp. NBC_00287]